MLNNLLLAFPENTQHSDTVLVRSQQRTTNMQCCSDVDATMSKLKRCSNITSTLDNKFNSWRTIHAVFATLPHCRSSQRLHNIDITT